MVNSKDKEEKGKKRTQSDEKWKEGRGGSRRDVGPWSGELGRGWGAPKELLVSAWTCWQSRWGRGLPVSPHTGRYSSCWMSSMISRPLPVPPFMLMSRGFPSCPELKV